MLTKQWFAKFISPQFVLTWAVRIWPYLFVSMVTCMATGLIWGLFFAPSDYQQGEAFRIIYVHVPSAFLSLMVYMCMAMSAAVFLIWRIKIADMIAQASAPVGALFTFLALITGSIWGKPMWGTWWIWDARLTSELILLFLFFGYMALRDSLPHKTGALASSYLAIIGVINIPIIHFSVIWWNTLHQGPTLSRLAKPAIDTSMLYPLLLMILGFVLYYACIICLQLQRQIREHKNG
jgi:heme exporter protein C